MGKRRFFRYARDEADPAHEGAADSPIQGVGDEHGGEDAEGGDHFRIERAIADAAFQAEYRGAGVEAADGVHRQY